MHSAYDMAYKLDRQRREHIVKNTACGNAVMGQLRFSPPPCAPGLLQCQHCLAGREQRKQAPLFQELGPESHPRSQPGQQRAEMAPG